MRHHHETPLFLFCLALVACGDVGVSITGAQPAGRALVCDPEDTWPVLSATSAGIGLKHLGDAAPASPDEVGDGMYHLFVGVLTGDMDEPRVRIFDSTSPTPEGPYTLAQTPLVDETHDYDRWGIETPSYLRADDHTEYIYYCGLFGSYDAGATGRISALKRVDGGAWTKIGPVAPELPGGWSQCEPDVSRDPETGLFIMVLQEATEDATGQHFGLFSMRTSHDPELFAPESEQGVLWDDGFVMEAFAPEAGPKAPKRPTVSRDPYADVWRFTWDLEYYTPHHAIQSWASTPIPERAELEANAATLHSGDHGLHSDIHLDTMVTDSNGWVGMPTSPLYPDEDTVLFFYSGWGESEELRVHAQRCRRE